MSNKHLVPLQLISKQACAGSCCTLFSAPALSAALHGCVKHNTRALLLLSVNSPGCHDPLVSKRRAEPHTFCAPPSSCFSTPPPAPTLHTPVHAPPATLLGKDNLLVVKDPLRHATLRALLQPAFSAEAIKTYLPAIQALVARHLGDWQVAGPEGVKAYPCLKMLTFDFILQVRAIRAVPRCAVLRSAGAAVVAVRHDSAYVMEQGGRELHA